MSIDKITNSLINPENMEVLYYIYYRSDFRLFNYKLKVKIIEIIH